MGKSKNKKQSYNPGNSSSNGSSNKKTVWNSKNSQNHSRVRSDSACGSVWSESEEHFPPLGAVAAPPPRVNVWEERKLKQEAAKALEPQSAYDEEFMLQQALALSMIEAENEERRRKEEEDYLLQVEALENISDELGYYVAPEELITNRTSKLETSSGTQSTKDFTKTSVSENNISGYNQNVKTHSCNGAKPKINKIIERFGGWGLKDEKATNNSERLSDFVDEVVSEKYLRKDEHNKVTAGRDKKDLKIVKENKVENLRHVSVIKEDKKPAAVSDPWEEDEVLYDEKGTFVVDEDESNDQINSASEVPKFTSPNKVLDTWLDSEDDVWGNDNALNDKKESSNGNNVQSDKADSNAEFVDYHMQKSGQFEERLASISADIDCKSEVASNRESNISDFYVCGKSSWPDHKAENESTKNFNVHNFDGNEYMTKIPHSADPAQAPHLPSNDILDDDSTNTSSYFTLFPDKPVQSQTEHSEMKSINFCSSIENEIFNSMSYNDNDDVPPILPPQPAPISKMNEENTTFINEALNTNLEHESLPIKPPQPVPEIQPPFPGMNPLLLNPAAMFPRFNPLLTCGMDPITMRQMLMLSNPFFASQLLAMEQYYRSMGMPVDLFSLPGSIPVASVPGMVGNPVEQNTFVNQFSSTNSSDSHLQSHFGNGSCVPDSQSNAIISDQKLDNCTRPLDFASLASSKNTLGVGQNDDNDSCYYSLSSNDTSAAIPPPKPPADFDVNGDNVPPIPAPSRPNQSTDSFNQHSLPSDVYFYSSASNIDKNHKLSAIEACITKTEVTGWSDDENESSKIQKTKTASGWGDEDFGWGNDSVPAKSFNSRSTSEGKRKTVCRQPSRQPQFSHYQRNKT